MHLVKPRRSISQCVACAVEANNSRWIPTFPRSRCAYSSRERRTNARGEAPAGTNVLQHPIYPCVPTRRLYSMYCNNPTTTRAVVDSFSSLASLVRWGARVRRRPRNYSFFWRGGAEWLRGYWGNLTKVTSKRGPSPRLGSQPTSETTNIVGMPPARDGSVQGSCPFPASIPIFSPVY